jgi:hypothetical protein
MPGPAWTDKHRAAVIQADLKYLTDERLAAWQRREAALQDKVRALEQSYGADAAAHRAVEDIDNLSAQIEQQTEALSELIPKPREGE